MLKNLRSALLVAMGLSTLSACGKGEQADSADTTQTAAAPARSLYDRLGGRDAIVAVVDSFVALAAADGRVNKKFARSDMTRVKTMLVEQICAQTGGPCTYTGRPMKEAHRNMGVTEGEFSALVEDLVTTLKAFNVPQAEQAELLAALGTMKGDVVEVQSPATGTPLPGSFVPAKGTP
jgi:hemoglobin